MNKKFKPIHKLISLTANKLALTCCVILSLSTQVNAQYVHTSGTKILDEQGNEIYFNGMNLGNWLLWEGYLMMGDFNYKTHTQFLNGLTRVFGDAAKAKEFEKQWRLNYVTEQTIIDLKNLGYNSVRVPFHYNMFWKNGALTNEGFVYFDNLVSWCKTHKIYILLDMHAAPGAQNPGDHSDNLLSNANQPRDSVKFWEGDNIAIASQIWRHIADRYKYEPIIWGYDLINEPVLPAGREYELAASLIAMRNAIREVDQNHIIVAEGHWWASQLQFLDWSNPTTQAATGIRAAWDNNFVLQTHHYIFGNTAWLADLYLRAPIATNMNVPFILGEYGEDTPTNLRTMKDWSAANIAGDFPWSFKKMTHDKTLWTITPNTIYTSVVNAINSNGTLPSAYDGMINFAKNNIANGKPGIAWHQDFYDATKPACNTKAPGNLTGTATSFSTIELKWLDNATGEDGYQISRNGTIVESIPANSKIFNDFNLLGETCYHYVVTTLAACNSSSSVKVCTPCNGQRYPYTGTRFSVPGIIEAEHFDTGCQGLTYSDTTAGNSGNALRSTDVDISATVDNGQSGHNIGWVDTGEWLEYAINVTEAGQYALSYRVATPQTTGQIQLALGTNLLSTTNIPPTGDWNNWATVNSSHINLPAGQQTLRILFSGKEVNLNYFTLSKHTTSSSSQSSSSAITSSSSRSSSSSSSSKSSVASSRSQSSISSSSSQSSNNSSAVNTAIISGRTYAIFSKNSNKVLDVSNNATSNGASIHQWSYLGNANQLWVVTHLSGNAYKIINKHSGRSLDVRDVSNNNGADIQQWDYQNNANQRWLITHLGNGYFKIIAESSGKSLDVRDISINNGAAIQQWDYSGSANQQWLFKLE